MHDKIMANIQGAASVGFCYQRGNLRSARASAPLLSATTGASCSNPQTSRCAQTSKASKFRPMAFDQAKADAICERVAVGETLASILPEIGISRTTLHNWRVENPPFGDKFARAKDAGYDAIAEDAMRIANTPIAGVIEKVDPDGGVTQTREDMLGHRRLQVETRLKLLAKWDPKRYGDRVIQEHDGKLTIELVDATARKDE